jgi:predicted phage tail protein
MVSFCLFYILSFFIIIFNLHTFTDRFVFGLKAAQGVHAVEARMSGLHQSIKDKEAEHIKTLKDNEAIHAKTLKDKEAEHAKTLQDVMTTAATIMGKWRSSFMRLSTK